LIIALGDYAWKIFGTGKISSVQGSFYQYTIKAGDHPELLREDFNVTILPTYHPSYALRGNIAGEKAIQQAFSTAKRFLEGESFDASKYEVLTDLDNVDHYIDTMIQWYQQGQLTVPAVACDLETEGLEWWHEDKTIVGVGFSYQEGQGFFIPYAAPNSPWRDDPLAILRVRSALKRMFDAVPLIGQGFDFDRRWLWAHTGLQTQLYFDTLSAHKWLYTDTRPNNLEYMAGAHTGMYLHKMEAKAGKLYDEENMGTAPIDVVGRLGAGDCDATLRVYKALRAQLEERGVFDAFMLHNMEPTQEMFVLDAAGAYYDEPTAESMGKTLRREKLEVSDRVKTLKINGKLLDDHFRDTYTDDNGNLKGLPILLSSYKRVAHLLYGVLHLPAPEKNSTAEKFIKGLQRYLDVHYPKTADEWNGYDPAPEVVEQMLVARAVLQGVLDFRAADKLLGTYVNGFNKFRQSDGCVHAKYHICYDVTGRTAASKPPMQGLPHPSTINFREAFHSRFHNGIIFETDESQIEVRCLAYYSQDRKMIEMFRVGQDMHRMVAARYLGKTEREVTKEERTKIKRVVFGMFYDRSAPSISEEYGIPVLEVEAIISAFWSEFQEAKRWKEQTVWYAQQYGGVWGAQKRYRLLPHIGNWEQKQLQREAERQAGNTPIQGLASDFSQHAIVRMIRGMRREKFASLPFHFVHDSFGVDVYPGDLFDLVKMADYEFVERATAMFQWFNVPFKVEHEIGLNIGQTVEIEIEDGKIVSVPTEATDVLNGIAEKISKWYNTRDVRIDADAEGKMFMTAEFDERKPVDRGEDWVAWFDEQYKAPALQPFYKRWTELEIPMTGGQENGE
jgi:DNA polymerase-1